MQPSWSQFCIVCCILVAPVYASLDIVLVLDGRVPVPEWHRTCTFAQKITNSFNIAPKDVHMGAVVLTSDALVAVSLTGNRRSLIDKIHTTGGVNGGSHSISLEKGITRGYDVLIDPKNPYTRLEARKIAILLTDRVMNVGKYLNEAQMELYTLAIDEKEGKIDLTFIDGILPYLRRRVIPEAVNTVAQVCEGSSMQSYLEIEGEGFPSKNVICKFDNSHFFPAEVFQAQSYAVVESSTRLKCPLPQWDVGGPIEVTVWHGGIYLFQLEQTFRYLTCTKQACKMQVDMILLLDGSGSINNREFEQMRTFAADMLTQMEYGEHAVRVGVLQFSNSVRTESPLSSDGVLAINSVERMGQLDDGTKIGLAFEEGQESLEDTGRPGAMKLMVLLTDGDNTGGPDPITESTEAKDKGTVIFCIGVGDDSDIEFEELEKYSSGSENVIRVEEGFEKLPEFVNRIVESLCPEVYHVEPDSSCLEGGSVITVTGKGFADTSRIECQFGYFPPVDAKYVSATQIQCIAPEARVPDTVSVEVAVSGGVFTKDGITFNYVNCTRSLTGCPGPQGIIFLIDGSSNLDITEFDHQLKFVSHLANEFPLNNDDTNVGAIQFGDVEHTREELPLSSDRRTITMTLEQIAPLSDPRLEWTAFGDGIRKAHTAFEGISRPASARLIVLITNGRENPGPSRDFDPVTEANTFKEHGGALLAVGVGAQANLTLLKEMATPPVDTFVISAGRFDHLIAYTEEVVRALCPSVLSVSPASMCEGGSGFIDIVGHGFRSGDVTCKIGDVAVEGKFVNSELVQCYINTTLLNIPRGKHPVWVDLDGSISTSHTTFDVVFCGNSETDSKFPTEAIIGVCLFPLLLLLALLLLCMRRRSKTVDPQMQVQRGACPINSPGCGLQRDGLWRDGASRSPDMAGPEMGAMDSSRSVEMQGSAITMLSPM